VSDVVAGIALPAGEIADAYVAPVSFSQQRLWMLDRMDPGRATYAVPLALRLRGALDVDALRRAFAELVARHESLRTVFRWLDGGPMQVVLPGGDLPVESIDLTSVDAASREAELRRRMMDEVATPFHLERGPLGRVRLYRLEEGEHVLFINQHHIVTDGWSNGVLLRELSALYGAFHRGEPSPLAEPQLQYADYADWQRERLRGAVYERHLAFWRGALANAPALLELPADRPRPPVWEGSGGVERFRLPRGLADAVEALAREEGCTPFMVLLAAFQALLGRYAGQEDVVVGSPVAGRTRAETEGLIGFFVNTLALRGDLRGDPPFRALLGRVREATLGAFEHQEMPFERLVEELKVPRSAAHAPVVQVLFILQTAGDLSVPIPGLEVESEPVDWAHARFDLTLSLRPRADGMDGALEYATALFDRDTAVRIVAHFRTLLAAACAAPGTRLSALPLLDGAERARLLADSAGPSAAYPDLPLHAMFEARAERTPGAVALVFGGERMTYGELDTRANRLAHLLRARGAGPERTVAVLMERSMEMVVALYGILKAGAAYVPVDPEYPADRVAYMLADSAAALVLTQLRWADAVPAGTERIALDVPGVLDAHPAHRPASVDARTDRLAYVIYTSGSTGRPKGAMNAHRGVVNRIRWMQDAFALSADEAVLQKTPFSFDVSVWEFFWPLAAGARLVIAAPGAHRDPGLLAELIERERVTTLHFVPSMLRAWLDAAEPGRCASLTRVMSSGEALPADLVDRFHAMHPSAELHNLYGPTEAAVDVTHWPCAPGQAAVPIGRPVANTRMYVLDARGGVCPAGVPGELWIAGVQVGRGYWRRPALTAERFAPDPFATVPGQRMYRTGDRARWVEKKCESARVRECESGSASADPSCTEAAGHEPTHALTHSRTLALEYLGRADFQVKVRGFRIEPGEIEAVLKQHPAVADAVVVVTGEDRHARLVAYLAARDGMVVPPVAELRERLSRTLPEYMVPTAFVALEEIPLTPSGKVDRRALPAPTPGGGTPSEVPLSRREGEVAEVWREVLGTDGIGPDDNFFDLGGNSLLLIRVAGRLKERLGSTVTAVELFRFPTVRTQAARIAGGEDESAADDPAGTRAGGLRQGARRLMHLRGAAGPAVPAHASEGRGNQAHREPTGAEIAIVGMAGRFPGAASVDALWDNLRAGVEGISRFTPDELRAAGVDEDTLADPAFVPAYGHLANAAHFDAAFFGFTPREAETTDPQQRVFLEVAWEAMEHAGYGPGTSDVPVGVYAGMGLPLYLMNNLLPYRELTAGGAVFDLVVSNDKDFLPTRVSYKLRLRGPSVTVQTACSTSLVAVHVACRALLGGECDLALAGGVSINSVAARGYTWRDGAIMSPDGHCRAFDEQAAGTVSGAGAAAVLLKRLEDAVADGDTIHGVILGSAINNDGAAKVGYMAPGADGQAAVIADALSVAAVDPRSIGYVEAHGTGTTLGDPIEVAALTRAYRAHTQDTGFCGLGSAKTSLGHLDAAAGVTGLIKAALALRDGVIPGSLHFTRPNPRLEIERTPFYVVGRTSEWSGPSPRRAAVSSFGIGGTNAHAVLEQPPAPAPRGGTPRPEQLLVLSARTEAALNAARGNVADFLERHPSICLADAAFTLQRGRTPFDWRLAVPASSTRDAVDGLRAAAGVRAADGRPVAFLFPGQGAQYVRMAAGVHASEPVYRDALDRCAEILRPELGFDLRDVLFPAAGDEDAATARLQQTAVTQPALFAVEYALAQQWMRWGVKPDAMLGHSVGEFVAACIAGVFTLEDALRLVAARGRLMQSLQPGGMLAVLLPEAELAPRLPEGVSLAAVNGPAACVVSGPFEAVHPFEAALAAEGVEVRRLHTSHAFHSAMMDPVLDPFRELVLRARPQPPRMPYVSGLTGTWITADEATDADYWARQLRRAVRFRDGVDTLLQARNTVLIEVGPGRTLGSLVPRGGAHATIPSLPHPRDAHADTRALADAVGRAWSEGVAVDWAAYGEGRGGGRIPLPTYPFQRRRYYIEAPRAGAGAVLALPITIACDEPDAADGGSAHGRPALRTAYVAPGNELEEAVAAVWSELLGIERVGVEDDFFELGGHSLLGTRVVGRLRADFGVALQVDAIFRAPTVAALAREVEEQLLAAVEAMSEEEALEMA
jgi:amino acid adenylation domain-containing protein